MSHRKSVTSHPSKAPGRQIGRMTTTKTIQYPSTEFAVGGGKKKSKVKIKNDRLKIFERIENLFAAHIRLKPFEGFLARMRLVGSPLS